MRKARTAEATRFPWEPSRQEVFPHYLVSSIIWFPWERDAKLVKTAADVAAMMLMDGIHGNMTPSAATTPENIQSRLSGVRTLPPVRVSGRLSANQIAERTSAVRIVPDHGNQALLWLALKKHLH
uniref:Uncharacterized protein n=1 Tax=Lygus hesperus TaxID=30085 RepID=A0A0K8SRT8_LYGHE